MRTLYALFVVSVLMFLTGLGLAVTGARAARSAKAPATTATTAPVASVGHIMQAIVNPAAEQVFGAVSTVVTAAGTEEKQPRTDEEWEAVTASAAVLVESGYLLQANGRAVDQGSWKTYADDMVKASLVALKAAGAKDAKGVFDSGEALYLACDNCHRTYQRTE